MFAFRRSGEGSPVFYRKSRFDATKSGTFWLSETPPKGPWRTLNCWRWRDTESSAALELREKLAQRSDWHRRIDYIYVSKGVKVKSYEVRSDARPGTKLYPSDHFPVMGTIEL